MNSAIKLKHDLINCLSEINRFNKQNACGLEFQEQIEIWKTQVESQSPAEVQKELRILAAKVQRYFEIQRIEILQPEYRKLIEHLEMAFFKLVDVASLNGGNPDSVNSSPVCYQDSKDIRKDFRA